MDVTVQKTKGSRDVKICGVNVIKLLLMLEL